MRDYGNEGNILVKYFSSATSTFILRVSRQHYRLAWTALSFITYLPLSTPAPPRHHHHHHHHREGRQGGREFGRACIMRVVRVSGTLRKAEEEAIRRARDIVLRLQSRNHPSSTRITTGRDEQKDKDKKEGESLALKRLWVDDHAGGDANTILRPGEVVVDDNDDEEDDDEEEDDDDDD